MLDQDSMMSMMNVTVIQENDTILPQQKKSFIKMSLVLLLMKKVKTKNSNLIQLILEIYLVSSGSLILVNRVDIPNEGLKVDGYDVLKNDGRVIVGRYFDGRMFLYQVFNYSPNGFLGRRNLPFIIQNN